MTPLAAYLAKQIVARPKHRSDIWKEPRNLNTLKGALEDVHCFETTQVFPLLGELEHIGKDQQENLISAYSFLPAPKTWLEWIHSSGNRIAVLLSEVPERAGVDPRLRRISSCEFFCRELACFVGYISNTSNDWYDGDPNGILRERFLPNWFADCHQNPMHTLLASCHCLLLMINSPKIIGRAQHMPNAGLERRLTKGLGAGSFPLHAWTELKLHVNKPLEMDDGEPHEAHLTGQRALHFVRKHIRIRLGRLEYVSAHWRGDPAIGIKQTRYVVAP